MNTWLDIITDAQDLLGISSVTALPNAMDTYRMARLLRLIILNLEAKEIRLGANIDQLKVTVDQIRNNASTLNNDSTISDQYLLAIECRLAVYSAPRFSLVPSRELLALAKDTYGNLFQVLPPLKAQNPFQPTGQGDRYYDDRPNFMTGRYGKAVTNLIIRNQNLRT